MNGHTGLILYKRECVHVKRAIISKSLIIIIPLSGASQIKNRKMYIHYMSLITEEERVLMFYN